MAPFPIGSSGLFHVRITKFMKCKVLRSSILYVRKTFAKLSQKIEPLFLPLPADHTGTCAKFSEKLTVLTPDMHVYVCVS